MEAADRVTISELQSGNLWQWWSRDRLKCHVERDDHLSHTEFKTVCYAPIDFPNTRNFGQLLALPNYISDIWVLPSEGRSESYASHVLRPGVSYATSLSIPCPPSTPLEFKSELNFVGVVQIYGALHLVSAVDSNTDGKVDYVTIFRRPADGSGPYADVYELGTSSTTDRTPILMRRTLTPDGGSDEVLPAYKIAQIFGPVQSAFEKALQQVGIDI